MGRWDVPVLYSLRILTERGSVGKLVCETYIELHSVVTMPNGFAIIGSEAADDFKSLEPTHLQLHCYRLQSFAAVALLVQMIEDVVLTDLPQPARV